MVIVVMLMSERVAMFGMIIAIGALPVFLVSFGILLWLVAGAVWRSTIPRMEAWWWLLTPYSVAFAACYRPFEFDRFAVHGIPLFVFVFMVGIVSTAAWTATTVLRAALSRKLPMPDVLMLASAILLGVLLLNFPTVAEVR
jgi:hypothetical protein